MCNGRSLSEWRLPDDGDDWSNAWRRMMEGGDGLAPIRAPNPSRAPGAQGYDEWGDKLCLPVGDVHFHGPCDVSRALVIEGHGHMNTRVYFHGCDGFRFWSRGSTSNPRPGNSGGGSSLNNMAVFSAETALPSAVGIRCEAPIRAENLHIQGFPSHGIAVDADRHRGDLTYDDPLTGSNANKCSFLNVRATLNGGHGWLFKGGDANACVLIGVGAENNGQWGFRDESFLGQWVLGAHASGNGDPTNPSHGDYWAARGGQHGVWLVYEESPNVAAGSLRRSHIYPPNIVINPRILVDEHNPLTWTSILGSDTASLVVGGLRAKRFGASVSTMLAPPDVDTFVKYDDDTNSDFWSWGIRRSGGLAGRILLAFKNRAAQALFAAEPGRTLVSSGDLQPALRRRATLPSGLDDIQPGEILEIVDEVSETYRRYVCKVDSTGTKLLRELRAGAG